ncbi:Snf-9 [Aphelenchoides bicaudatus]|nr:Snf-9 [Aphelenchoides bicaudatus]
MESSERDLSRHNLRELNRPTWSTSFQFFFTITSYAVGLGNVWRFPALVYEQGGGAFLIPYFFCSFLVGFPLLYLELSLGQFSRSSPAIVFGRIKPILQGNGWAMVCLSFLVSIYYNMIVAWSIIFLFSIVTGTATWDTCTNDYNTIYCQSSLEDDRCTRELSVANQTVSAFYFNGSCYPTTDLAMRYIQNQTFSVLAPVSSSEEFFENYVLQKSPTLEVFGGGLNYKLVMAYAVAWLITASALCRGPKIIGKLKLFPYIFCIFLFIRSVTLEGAMIGMDFYLFKPDFSIVFDPAVWRAAATHVSFSLSIGFGGMIALSSYNNKQHNCYKDAVFVTIADAVMSLLGGSAVFSILGFMSHQLNVPISKVVQSGTGVAFIAFPEALARMPFSWFWSLLFFLMIWILGLSTQFGYGEIIIGAMSEQFPGLLKHKATTTFGVCGVLYACGLCLLCTRSGIFYFNILNDYASSLSLVFVVFFEAVIICYIYGYKNYRLDLEEMFGKAKSKLGRVFGPTGLYIEFVLKIVAPILMAIIFVFALLTQITTDLTYGKGNRLYVLPRWSIGLGWCVSLVPLLFLPTFAIYNWLKFKKRNLSWRELFLLQPKWPSYFRQVKQTISPVDSNQAISWSEKL